MSPSQQTSGPTCLGQLRDLLNQRILIMDGAMGTVVQGYELSEREYRGDRFANHEFDLQGNNDLITLTQPQILQQIHRDFLAAGADIIETNTFTANTPSQADYGLEEYVLEINHRAAEIARSVANEFTTRDPERPRFVAGALGPTNRTASISPDVNRPGFRNISFDDLVTAYDMQLRGLIEGGVDLIAIETIFDTLNAKAAILACSEYTKLSLIHI